LHKQSNDSLHDCAKKIWGVNGWENPHFQYWSFSSNKECWSHFKS
jgi:hypothetical protein